MGERGAQQRAQQPLAARIAGQGARPDGQVGRVDQRWRAEAGGRDSPLQPQVEACDPPGGGEVAWSRRGQAPRHAPFHQQVRAGQRAQGIVQQAAQQRGGDRERDACHHAVGAAGEWHLARVAVDHRDLAGGEAPLEAARQPSVTLDGDDPRASGGQRHRDRAVTGAEVEHEVAWTDPGAPDQLSGDTAVAEEVGSGVIGRRAGATDHGRP
jgi:hypothetical protein